ncbi:ABC transporter permease [Paenibacillus pasadenensis]|uniref:ABC transporter permease n=1 Tax=Paenibacillus pasadenensis TaxID=217090 RepID=UPI0003FC75F5|nr:ABC transporter permease [Paenibacillus pasadenensis]
MTPMLRIALKEIRTDFRDRKTFFLLLGFPLLLILILGTALSGSFDSESGAVLKPQVLVQDASGGDKPLAEAFAAFRRQAETNGVVFTDASGTADGTAEVEAGRYDSFVRLTPSGMEVHGSTRHPIESNIAQGMLQAFADRYNASAAIGAQRPQALQSAFSASESAGGYVQERSIDENRKPGSMDYYALAMTVAVALWGALSSVRLVAGERAQGTAARLMAAPVRKSDIFAGKVLGNVVVNSVCILAVVLLSKWAFGAYWGDNLPLALALLLTVVLLATSLGLFFSYLLQGKSAGGVVMLLVQLAAFFGGAYFPVSTKAADASLLNLWSPVYWANSSLSRLVYEGQIAPALQTMALNLGLALLLLAASAWHMNKKEEL